MPPPPAIVEPLEDPLEEPLDDPLDDPLPELLLEGFEPLEDPELAPELEGDDPLLDVPLDEPLPLEEPPPEDAPLELVPPPGGSFSKPVLGELLPPHPATRATAASVVNEPISRPCRKRKLIVLPPSCQRGSRPARPRMITAAPAATNIHRAIEI
jgi:hypothetical protein